MLRRSALVLTLILLPSSLAAEPPGVWALVGGRVHPVASPPIENGTVVIRDGLIEAVGARVAIPPDAVVVEVEGLNVYPGLFDAHTTFGLPRRERSGGAARESREEPAAAEPTASTEAARLVTLTADALDARRATGVTTVLTVPREGNFNGQSAILNLGEGEIGALILRAPASTHVSFNTKTWGRFPDSLMGAIYHARQTLLDAQWLVRAREIYDRDPRGRRRPEASPDLDALAPALRREIPVVFSASDQVRIRRAADIGREMGLRWIVSGATEAWELGDLLAAAKAPVLFSVEFPRKPGIAPEDQSLREIRDRVLAPTGPAELARRNVEFALVSGPSLPPRGFIDGVRRSIENGLDEQAALRAVTLTPARIFGLDRQIGSLEPGRIANVLVTEKKFWEKDAKVRHLFIDGLEMRLPAEKEDEAEASAPAEGTWDLTIRMPEGEVFMQVVLSTAGDQVTGSYSGDRGSGSIREGSVEGERVSFSIAAPTAPGGETSDWRFSGTVEGNSIDGEVVTSLGTFAFTGRKPE
ncbi:MAG TPA: amidohydrolase family protein [Thermoanaerobaculia bacterium]|nr:amidohydrolase family protein [Thermoanaerobaculia bacterium]